MAGIPREQQNGAGTAPVLFKAFYLPLFLFILCIYALCAPGHLNSRDGMVIAGLSVNIAQGRGLAATPEMMKEYMGEFFPGRGGKWYSKYGPLHSMLMLPFTAAGLAAGRIAGFEKPSFVTFFFVSFFSAIPTALTGVLVAAICLGIGLAKRNALLAALSFAFGTMAFPYARFDFSEPLVSLALCAAAFFLLRYEKTGRAGFLFASGLVLGMAPFVKFLAGFAMPVFGLAALLICIRKRKFRDVFIFLASSAAGVIALGIYNFALFGSFAKTGYSGVLGSDFSVPLSVGMYGMLLSGGKGLFFYSPILILFLFAFRRYARLWPSGAWLAGALLISLALGTAKFAWWGGGHAWGPRYILPTIPLLAVAAGVFLQAGAQKWRTAVFAPLFILSVSVQLIPVVQKYFVAYENGDAEPQRIMKAYEEHRLLRPGMPEFTPQAATARRALDHLRRWPAYWPEVFRSGRAIGGLTPDAFFQSKAIENAPDVWPSLFLYLRIPALTLATLLAVAALAAAAVLQWRKIMKFVRDEQL